MFLNHKKFYRFELGDLFLGECKRGSKVWNFGFQKLQKKSKIIL